MSSDEFIVNVECAIRHAGKWLMIVRGADEEHAPGALSMVGGKVERTDPTEGILEAAVRREVLEEVGIELTADLRYVESKSFVTDSGQWVLDVVFLAVGIAGTPRSADVGEVASIVWMTTEDILDGDTTPSFTAQSIRLARALLAPGE